MSQHSITIKAPELGRRKGTTVSMRDRILQALDKEFVLTPEGIKTQEGMKSHGGIVESVTVTFNYLPKP
jgi:hypothetical protein